MGTAIGILAIIALVFEHLNGKTREYDAYNAGVEDTKRFYENLRKEN